MNLKIKYLYALCISFMFTAQSGYSQSTPTKNDTLPSIKISQNQHYFVTEIEKPFFWLGDTGWLTLGKLNRADVEKYFQDRKEKGFNVVQVMVLHTLNVKNAYGDAALTNEDISKPLVTPGNDFNNPTEYDYWDHVDYVLDVAQKNGIYLAMVPVWGTNVSKGDKVSKEQAQKYAKFLANRYQDRTNIIWLNGGDTHGNEFTTIWNILWKILTSKFLAAGF